MAQNRGRLPPLGDVSRGRFPSETTKSRAPGSTRLGTPSCPRPPVEIVGKFQILVKLNSMNTNTSVSIARILYLQRGNRRVRDHTDERSVWRWRIAGVEGLRGHPIDRWPRWLCHSPCRRRRQRSRVEGKSFGIESGALEREGSRCITFPLAPCLCCYSLGAIDHPTTETFAWVGGGASPRHVNATSREATSPAATCCWCHPRTRACARMQEHVVRVVKISESRTLCDHVKIKMIFDAWFL
jgi:hypothetical protein